MRVSSCLGRAFSLVVGAWLGAAGAQSASDAPHYAVDTLVVEALRAPATLGTVPYSVSRFDVTAPARADPGLSLQEALAPVPGLLVARRHNLSQGDRLVLRGIGARASFGVRGVRILLDDIPLTLADGQAQPGVVDLARVDEVEVLSGPAAALYGNAAGGVIRLRAHAPEGPRRQAAVLVGSDGLRQVRVGAEHVGADAWLSWGASHTDLEGDRAHANARQRTLGAIARRRLADDWEVRAVAHLYDAPYLLNPSSLDRAAADADPQQTRFFVRQQGSAKQVRHGQLGLQLARTGAAGADSRIAAYAVDRTLLNPIPGRVVELDRLAWGLRLDHRQPLRPGLEAAVGLEWEAQRDERDEFANAGLADADVDRFDDDRLFAHVVYGDRLIAQDERASGLGLFALARWRRPAERLQVTAGVRVDRQRFAADDRLLADGDDSGSRTLAEWSPTLGVVWAPHPWLAIWANAATAFLTPTTVELGNRADGRGGFNPDLEPEHYRSGEVGLRGLWPGAALEGEVALYRLQLDDMLVPFQLAGGDEVYYRNASRARNLGTEARLAWHPTAQLDVDASATALDFTFAGGDLSGNQVPGMPPRVARAALTWRPASPVMARLALRHESDMYANDGNGPAPDSSAPRSAFVRDAFTTLDLRASLRRHRGAWETEIFAGLDNLFAADFSGSVVPNAAGNRFFEPAPGRTVYVGLRLAQAPANPPTRREISP